MKTLKAFNVKNKRVLVRVDFNVPLDKKGNITNDKRIRAALPTIKHLIKNNAMIILMSHLGRPDGKIVKTLTMEKVGKRLKSLLKRNVYYQNDCIGNDIEDFIDKMVPGEVVLLENLRFYKQEKQNNKQFASSLADLADIYINDAFGTCHRAHASVEAITKYLPSAPGFLLEKEIKELSYLKNPKKPFVAILGGAKVSDKIGVINNLLKKADKLLIGGAMAFTFLKSMGFKTGGSIVEKDKIPLAKQLLKKTDKIVLTMDNVIGDAFEPDAKKKTIHSDMIPDGWQGLDIGPNTIKLFKKHLKGAKTIIWNGTLGMAEWPRFRKGSAEIAKFLAKSRAKTIIGGGDTAALVDLLKLENKMSHVSTGGGAALEFLEGKTLPALKALNRK